jgi:hypothetical protein
MVFSRNDVDCLLSALERALIEDMQLVDFSSVSLTPT